MFGQRNPVSIIIVSAGMRECDVSEFERAGDLAPMKCFFNLQFNASKRHSGRELCLLSAGVGCLHGEE